MKITFSCSKCGARLRADERSIGRTVSCPACNASLIIAPDKSDEKEAGNQLFSKVNEAFGKTLAMDKLEGFSFMSFFSKVFQHHPWNEWENLCAVGTDWIPPDAADNEYSYPTPWLFSRFFLWSLLSLFVICWRSGDIGDAYSDYLLLILGVICIPMSTLVFFWEINAFRNISIAQVIKVVLIGGFFSTLLTLLLSSKIDFVNAYSQSTPVSAGIIEEITKGAVMLLFIRNKKYPYRLNGLILGAALGCGFSIIETGGYVLAYGEDALWIRAFFAPLGHVMYSALVGYALWNAKENGVFKLKKLVSAKSIRLIVLAMVLHMFWNSSWMEDERLLRACLVGILGYGAVLYAIQDGMKQLSR